MKNSREPIWKQHRRITEKGNGGASGGGSETGENTTKVPVLTPVAVAATGSVAGAGGKGGSRESQVEAGKKLTQKLAKSSAEGRFSRKDVLDILQKVSYARDVAVNSFGSAGNVVRMVLMCERLDSRACLRGGSQGGR